MPTRYSMHAYRPAPSWGSTWDFMYSKLEPLAVEILAPTGFYERYDIEVPDEVKDRKLNIEEKDAIGRIATALTIAADVAHRTPPGIVAAWLDRIAKNPALFRSEQLPPEVHWQIATARGGGHAAIPTKATTRESPHRLRRQYQNHLKRLGASVVLF